jgi:hypothetical protein
VRRIGCEDVENPDNRASPEKQGILEAALESDESPAVSLEAKTTVDAA